MEGTRDVGLQTVKVKVHVVLSGVLDVSLSERQGFRSEQKFKWKVLQYVAVCCSVLQCVAARCSVTVCCRVVSLIKKSLRTIFVL